MRGNRKRSGVTGLLSVTLALGLSACALPGDPSASGPTPGSPTALPTPASPNTLPIAVRPVFTPAPTRAKPHPTSQPNASAAGWTFPWSASDTAWAISTLTTDMADDTAAEARFPAQAAYYAGWASHWSLAIDEIHGLHYPQTAPPPAAYLAPMLGWFQEAYELHLADMTATPRTSGGTSRGVSTTPASPTFGTGCSGNRDVGPR